MIIKLKVWHALFLLVLLGATSGLAYYLADPKEDEASIQVPSTDFTERDSVGELSEESDEDEVQKNENTRVYPESLSWSEAGDPKPALALVNSVVFTKDAILTLHGSKGAIYASRHYVDENGETVSDKQTINTMSAKGTQASMATPGALASDGENILAVWVEPKGLYGALSKDGGKNWADPEFIGERSVGPLTPSACIWEAKNGDLNAFVSWVLPPQKTDGGPLFLRSWSDGAWGATQELGAYETASGTNLSCSDEEQSMIFRDGSDGANLQLYLTTHLGGGEWSEAENILAGADPKLAICGENAYAAYHDRGTHVAKRGEEGSWEPQLMDEKGKFESLACDEDAVIVAWGAYESIADANNKQNPKLAVRVSLDEGLSWESWSPDEGDIIKQRSVAVSGSVFAVLWTETDGVIHLATKDVQGL